MTREEAINVLEDGDWWNDLSGYISLTTMQDLQDALDVAIAALREQEERRWIPVAEKRPNGECLAISMLPGTAYKEMLVGWIGKVEEWESGYICESDGAILPNVTHWMPLPEPPKEKIK